MFSFNLLTQNFNVMGIFFMFSFCLTIYLVIMVNFSVIKKGFLKDNYYGLSSTVGFYVLLLIFLTGFFQINSIKCLVIDMSLTNLYTPHFSELILLISFILIVISGFSLTKETPMETNFIIGILFISSLSLIYSFDFLTMFLTLELQNFALYILINIQRNKKIVIETSIKYYIIGGISSGFLLYGISLIYIVTGKLNFFELSLFFYGLEDLNFLLFQGILFIICGILIKLGLAPFHFWIPQVYNGVPNFITLILLSLPKFVLIIIFIKLYFFVFCFMHYLFFNTFCICIILSLSLGALGALWQLNIKQFFGYSAITNTGFILLGLINLSPMGLFSGYFYLLIYLFTTIITFYSFMLIKNRTHNKFNFLSFSSLVLVNPLYLFTISINLLSFAGIPPLPGFFSKFFILLNLIELEFFKLTFFTMFISIFAAYYYIRPIKIFFFSMTNRPLFIDHLPFIPICLISIGFLINLQFSYHINTSFFNVINCLDLNNIFFKGFNLSNNFIESLDDRELSLLSEYTLNNMYLNLNLEVFLDDNFKIIVGKLLKKKYLCF